jgi:hypothetical protein
MGCSMIHIRKETHDALRSLSRASGMPMTAILAEALRLYQGYRVSEGPPRNVAVPPDTAAKEAIRDAIVSLSKLL